MAQKKQKSIGRRPTKADMKLLDKNIARYERQGWDSQVKGMKRFKKEQIVKMKRTDKASRISKLLAENKGKTAKFKKVAAKKGIGRAIAKRIPAVAAGYMAHDIIKAVSKSTCSKRGGKWVKGKCQGVTKSKSVTSGKDPRFAKSRSKK